MAARRVRDDDNVVPLRPPATTPEGRENQLIALAVDEAERQMRSGEASSQIIAHYLKLGSSREKLEQERLVNENALLIQKREVMATAARVEDLMAEALQAFTSYQGEEVIPVDPHQELR